MSRWRLSIEIYKSRKQNKIIRIEIERDSKYYSRTINQNEIERWSNKRIDWSDY